MKKKKKQISSFRMLCISLAVSIVVMGVGGALFVKASETSDGGLIKTLQAVESFLGKLSTWKSVDTAEDLGLAVESDEIQSANFNNVGWRTNADNPDDYVNIHEEYMGLLSGAASSTVLSIKNTWQQNIVVSDIMFMPLGAPSSTIEVFAGTSTRPSVPFDDANTNITECGLDGSAAKNIIVTSTLKLISSLDPASAAPELGACLVKPNEYFLIFVQAEDPTYSVTSSPTTHFGTDFKASVRVRVLSTSTQYY